MKLLAGGILLVIALLAVLDLAGCAKQTVTINSDECVQGHILVGRFCVTEDKK